MVSYYTLNTQTSAFKHYQAWIYLYLVLEASLSRALLLWVHALYLASPLLTTGRADIIGSPNATPPIETDLGGISPPYIRTAVAVVDKVEATRMAVRSPVCIADLVVRSGPYIWSVLALALLCRYG